MVGVSIVAYVIGVVFIPVRLRSCPFEVARGAQFQMLFEHRSKNEPKHDFRRKPLGAQAACPARSRRSVPDETFLRGDRVKRSTSFFSLSGLAGDCAHISRSKAFNPLPALMLVIGVPSVGFYKEVDALVRETTLVCAEHY
jgi:hypothetical protein